MIKKIISKLILLILVPAALSAWDDCPYNEIDCPFPGDCNRYVDIDKDGICDRSQPAPENRNDSIADIQLTEYGTEEIQGVVTGKESGRIYHLLPIPLFLVILYFITFVLSKKKIISVVNHRKIWNILLVIAFLISGILGILLIVKINFSTEISLPLNILFWHVEFGIAMFAISIFHILWHWTYFKNLFRIKK